MLRRSGGRLTCAGWRVEPQFRENALESRLSYLRVEHPDRDARLCAATAERGGFPDVAAAHFLPTGAGIGLVCDVRPDLCLKETD